MDLLIRASALLVVSSLTGLLIRKNNPEFALLLCLSSVTTVFLMTASLAGELTAFMDTIDTLTSSSAILTTPVLKCLAIAVITQITSELCRDASHGAASSAAEFTGTVCALCAAMPLILSVMRTIGGLL